MLAGATGIDLALLVVAADDSVMPQTREHLEILRLLGLRHGVVALTKCDLVDATTREVVELEVRELVQGTFLENAALVGTSAHTGLGIDVLKAAIAEACTKVEQRAGKQWFRMAIDRAFVVQGHGTVVTGSATSGSVAVGDELQWQPRGETVRVRSLQNHDEPVQEVHRGQRAAINLAGVRHEDVLRGQELATPGYLQPACVLTVRLHCLAEMKRPIKHRLPVRFHLGTSELMGTVSLLDCDSVAPGQWGIAQVFLDEDATATWGQPFVVRESAATETLGGGQVLQPAAKKVRRRHLETLERIETLWTGDARGRARTVAWFGGFGGFTLADLVRGSDLGPDEAAAMIERLKNEGELVDVAVGPARRLLLHKDMVHELEERVAEGHLARVTDDIYLHGDADAEMRRLVTQRLQAGAGLTVAEIRDLLGTTRKYAVPLCEYLDRVGVTRREGDLRLLNQETVAK
jgi:selenocysteine-specific elongation factor